LELKSSTRRKPRRMRRGRRTRKGNGKEEFLWLKKWGCGVKKHLGAFGIVIFFSWFF